MRQIILASASPRRKELLRQLMGDNFKVVESPYHEKLQQGMNPLEFVIHNSREKAKEVASVTDHGIVIGADTVVLCNGEILGKPHTEDKARETLKLISGKKVHVVTGLTVIDIDADRQTSVSETTDITIKKMSDAEIEAYVRTAEPIDKAGAFAIQGKGAIIVERIEGDYFNVVGLPLFKLNKVLLESGIDILDME
ncbi:MAG: Maf-like protein [Methanomethylovorans sp. PtaU1.Bin093]|uniref:Maf family nucleotide pyrophosphatase n=1 Tax=Methanomethylovorans sp. PtaU1.Bin093 TaxID=1811679 RepID=UPI0009CC678C|nr:Maf family nucleotide pyrophosphatase [Methanomethylovorans sp. PtaU1.Bin093]OPY21062.1 MAG: Maf-like protein [Methanomethylovorans sp. PtaU1.Bin093]